MLSPCVQGSTRKLPYLDYLPVPATLKYCAVTGFEIPSLPVLAQEYSDARGTLARQTLDRFQQYLLELHSDAPAQRAIALQLMALPEGVSVAARVRINVLCRSAHDAADKAALDADDFVRHAAASFPRSGMFGYGQPKWLEATELEHACFRQGGIQDSDIDLVELRKFEDRWPWSQQLSVQYVPHRFWANRGLDPWLVLIENLAAVTRPAAVRIELTPTRLERSSGLDSMSVAARWFTLYGQDLERIAKQGEQVRTDGVVTSEMYRAGDVGNFSTTAQGTSYVQRGRHVYEQLMAHADRLFGMRVTIASHGRVPESLIGSVRAALSSPPSDDEIGSLGWVRPDVVRPETEKSAALENLRYLAQTRWGRTDPVRPPGPQTTGAAALGPQVNLRPFATPEEATSLFHLPIFDRSSETSALS
ncbi:MAG: hypothetical protein JWM26_1322, partial [Betaproteobacteria bacterium]|nr:hypothetical protein [Betaproteobacteria bacterium]